jgi:hypothetical protein
MGQGAGRPAAPPLLTVEFENGLGQAAAGSFLHGLAGLDTSVPLEDTPVVRCEVRSSANSRHLQHALKSQTRLRGPIMFTFGLTMLPSPHVDVLSDLNPCRVRALSFAERGRDGSHAHVPCVITEMVGASQLSDTSRAISSC